MTEEERIEILRVMVTRWDPLGYREVRRLFDDAEAILRRRGRNDPVGSPMWVTGDPEDRVSRPSFLAYLDRSCLDAWLETPTGRNFVHEASVSQRGLPGMVVTHDGRGAKVTPHTADVGQTTASAALGIDPPAPSTFAAGDDAASSDTELQASDAGSITPSIDEYATSELVVWAKVVALRWAISSETMEPRLFDSSGRVLVAEFGLKHFRRRHIDYNRTWRALDVGSSALDAVAEAGLLTGQWVEQIESGFELTPPPQLVHDLIIGGRFRKDDTSDQRIKECACAFFSCRGNLTEACDAAAHALGQPINSRMMTRAVAAVWGEVADGIERATNHPPTRVGFFTPFSLEDRDGADDDTNDWSSDDSDDPADARAKESRRSRPVVEGKLEEGDDEPDGIDTRPETLRRLRREFIRVLRENDGAAAEWAAALSDAGWDRGVGTFRGGLAPSPNNRVKTWLRDNSELLGPFRLVSRKGDRSIVLWVGHRLCVAIGDAQQSSIVHHELWKSRDAHRAAVLKILYDYGAYLAPDDGDVVTWAVEIADGRASDLGFSTDSPARRRLLAVLPDAFEGTSYELVPHNSLTVGAMSIAHISSRHIVFQAVGIAPPPGPQRLL